MTIFPLPRCSTLPRRRRRRRPADAPAAVAAGAVVDGDDSPEANVRAAAAVDPSVMGGAAPSSAVNRMERMLGASTLLVPAPLTEASSLTPLGS